jgi:hypothetical protein
MRRIPQAIYMTPDELDQRILELTVEAHHLEDSEERQAILKEIAQLRQLEAWPLIAAVQASIPAATTPRQL